MTQSLNVLACHHCDHREKNCLGCKCKADPDGRPFIQLAEAGACPLKRHGDGAQAFIESMKGRIVQQALTTSAGEVAALQSRVSIQRALWREIHLLALAGQLTGEKLDGILQRLPCGTCKNHFNEIRKADPLPSESALQLEWSVRAHNAVNRSLGKPEWAIEDARSIYTAERRCAA